MVLTNYVIEFCLGESSYFQMRSLALNVRKRQGAQRECTPNWEIWCPRSSGRSTQHLP
jgi:hypothetical protein